MATLYIPTKAIADEIVHQLKDRYDNFQDMGIDDPEDHADYEEMFSLQNAIEDVTEYPATLNLSDAEVFQAFVMVESICDFNSDDLPQVDIDATYDHLTHQGYANAITNIFDYCKRVLGFEPDAEFRNLPLDSTCGSDCAKAIRAADTFLKHVKSSVGDGYEADTVREIARTDINVYYHG